MMRRALLAMSRSDSLARFMTTNRFAWGAASRFVAGRSIGEAIDTVSGLNDEGLTATLDYLGENVTERSAADQSVAAYIQAVDRIRAGDIHSGISLKLTALGLDIGDDVAEERLRQVVIHAGRKDPPVFVRIDMEGSDYTQRTIEMFERVHADHDNVGIVLQSYLYRTDDDVERMIELGAGVRLVKGAYLESETIAYPEKADVDAAFLRQAERLMSASAREAGVYLAIGTHDSDIIDWARAHSAANDIPRDTFEFQMLFGVRRDYQRQLADDDYRVRIYVPYGDQWYPYFMRRLAERPENLAFVLRAVVGER